MQKQSLQHAFVKNNQQKAKDNERYMRLRRAFTHSHIRKRTSQAPILPPITTIR